LKFGVLRLHVKFCPLGASGVSAAAAFILRTLHITKLIELESWNFVR